MQVQFEADQTNQQPRTDVAEDELLHAISRGDRKAFAQVVVQYSATIQNYLRVRLVSPADADDICQEVFLRSYKNRDQFRRARSARGWLLGFARNVLREHLRKKIRRDEIWTRLCVELAPLLNGDGFDSRRQDSEILEHLPGCIASLGPDARQIIEWRYRDDLSMSEIGELTQRSKGAVRVTLHRARQTIKKCLTKKLDKDRITIDSH